MMLAVLLPIRIPVDPDVPTARQWLTDELRDPAYRAAEPTWFDRASKAMQDWLGSLFQPSGGDFSALVPLVVTVLVAALIVAAFLIFGIPRLNRRSARDGVILGSDDHRNSTQLRASAATAARAEDWAGAIMETFRAIARSLSERTVITMFPGTTAREVAARAALAFPEFAPALREAAAAFDSVRYQGGAGSRGSYLAIAELDRALAAATPLALTPAGTSAVEINRPAPS
ncbi:MAG: DUF4129 domain-containing protein [Microbacteriaceae bacterium]